MNKSVIKGCISKSSTWKLLWLSGISCLKRANSKTEKYELEEGEIIDDETFDGAVGSDVISDF